MMPPGGPGSDSEAMHTAAFVEPVDSTRDRIAIENSVARHYRDFFCKDGHLLFSELIRDNIPVIGSSEGWTNRVHYADDRPPDAHYRLKGEDGGTITLDGDDSRMQRLRQLADEASTELAAAISRIAAIRKLLEGL